jgi:MFS family permease
MMVGGMRIGRGRGLGTGGADSERPALFTRAFVMVAIAELAYFTADGVLILGLPRYVEGALGGDDIAVGVVMGAFSISAFFLRPLAGRIADNRGRRVLMIVGALVFAGSVAGYLVANTIPVLIGMRLLTGVGEAMFFVAALAANVDLAPPERRGEALSFASLALYIGLGAGPFIAEALIERIGFGAAWWAAIGLALAAAALALRLPPMRPEIDETQPPTPHRLLHRRGVLPGLVLLAAVWGMAGFLAFVPLYALDIGMSGAGLVLGLFSAVVVAIRSVGATIPDRFGPARVTRVALAVSAVGLLMIGSWREPIGLIVGAAVLGLGMALFTPALFTMAVADVPANERGAVMGTTSAFLDVALGVGPASLGFVAASFGRGGTFLAASAVAAAGLVLVSVTRMGRPVPVVGAVVIEPEV